MAGGVSRLKTRLFRHLPVAGNQLTAFIPAHAGRGSYGRGLLRWIINKDLSNEERGNWIIEYVDEDAKEIGEALKTLILKCTNNKSYELNCTITFGE